MRGLQLVYAAAVQHQCLMDTLESSVEQLWAGLPWAEPNHMSVAHQLPISVQEFMQLQQWAGVARVKAQKKHPSVAPATQVSVRPANKFMCLLEVVLQQSHSHMVH
jgi:hypothetical protein